MKTIKYTYHLYFEISSKTGNSFFALTSSTSFVLRANIIILTIPEIILKMFPISSWATFKNINLFLCSNGFLQIRKMEMKLIIEHIARKVAWEVFEISTMSSRLSKSIVPENNPTA